MKGRFIQYSVTGCQASVSVDWEHKLHIQNNILLLCGNLLKAQCNQMYYCLATLMTYLPPTRKIRPLISCWRKTNNLSLFFEDIWLNSRMQILYHSSPHNNVCNPMPPLTTPPPPPILSMMTCFYRIQIKSSFFFIHQTKNPNPLPDLSPSTNLPSFSSPKSVFPCRR